MELYALLEDAGLEHSRKASTLGHVSFPSMDAFVHTEIQATPLAARIDEATYLAIARDTRSVLSEYEQPDVTVSLPIRARFSAGRKPSRAPDEGSGEAVTPAR